MGMKCLTSLSPSSSSRHGSLQLKEESLNATVARGLGPSGIDAWLRYRAAPCEGASSQDVEVLMRYPTYNYPSSIYLTLLSRHSRNRACRNVLYRVPVLTIA